MADRRITARDLAQIAVFAALIAAMSLAGQVSVGGPVPITLQTLGVMLAGSLLGARNGTLAVLTFLAVGLLGVPVFPGGVNTWQRLAGPSVGYIVGFVAGALVIGFLTRRLIARFGRYRAVPGLLSNVLGGVVVIYLFGIPGVAVRTQIGLGAATVSALPFLIGDAIKVLVATLVALGVHRAYPQLLGSAARDRTAAGTAP